MKYIINERQYKLLTEEQEVLHIPSLEVLGDWETLQKFLERRGNPPYSIGGDLKLKHTNIETLGNLISVGGSLDLDSCENLPSLGNLTSVGGYLDLRGTKIESLGNLTSVGASFDLSYSSVESLGNLTSVGGFLILRKTPVSEKYSKEEIRQMVDVGGDIIM